MFSLNARHAAARLKAADQKHPNRNGPDLLIAVGGGYGAQRQKEVLDDIRELYAYILGTRPTPDFNEPEAA